MSAIAARRAAQAARVAAKSSAPEPATTRKAAKAAKARSPSKEPSPEPAVQDSESEPEPSGSNKRRKANGLAKTRYHEVPEEEEDLSKSTKRRRRRQRAFSPSAAQDSDVDDEEGSSGDEDEEIEVLEELGGTTPWSVPATPRMADAGPSRLASASTLRPSSSKYNSREGHNLARVTEATLAAAGANVPGPGVVISLGEGDELLIAGAYTITPLSQTLGLLSTTLQPAFEGESIKTYPVFAPTSHPLPVLTALPEEDMLLESPLLARLKLPNTFSRDASRTVFLIQENRCGIEDLRGDVVPGFHNIWVDDGLATSVWGLRNVHPVLDNFQTPVYSHHTASSWHTALDSLVSGHSAEEEDELASPPPQDRVPVVLVKGPKRSGKSSIARAALNRLLSTYERVAWLECDLGQGEFGCGGAVGLWVLDSPVLGPNFTHPRVPARAHFLGELSPQACPDEYMAAIHQLVAYYQYEVQFPLTHSGGRKQGDAVPLVVNTQGWVKGLGEDLMRAIEASTEPTHVFSFEAAEEPISTPGGGWTTSPVHQVSDLPNVGWEAAASSTAAPPLVFTLALAPTSPLQARYTAADMRTLSTTAYMYARLGESPTWDFSNPLFAIAPWTVNLGAGQSLSTVYLLGESSDAILPDDLPLSLNGSLVALIEAQCQEGDEVYVPGRTPPLDDSTFLGVALARAVRYDPASTSESTLQTQLITPLSAATLARATAIVRNGALELPTSALLDFRERPGGGVAEDGLAGTRWSDVPFFDATESRAAGGDRRKFRRNIQRKGV